MRVAAASAADAPYVQFAGTAALWPVDGGAPRWAAQRQGGAPKGWMS